MTMPTKLEHHFTQKLNNRKTLLRAMRLKKMVTNETAFEYAYQKGQLIFALMYNKRRKVKSHF